MPDQTSRYQALEKSLAVARQQKNLTQAQIAEKLKKPQSFVSKYETGERRLDVIEFLEVCEAISANPYGILSKLSGTKNTQYTIFRRWDITPALLAEIIQSNPSLRGMVLGYVAEQKALEAFSSYPEITDLGKDDDHDRKKKGDRRIRYNGRVFKIEVKSLQTNAVKQLGGDEWRGKFQCDASDRRPIVFPDGSKLETTNLLRGEFDVVAVNCFAFGDKWRFAYAVNQRLPTSQHAKYSATQRTSLIASTISITWPPTTPFSEDLISVLNEATIVPQALEIEEKEAAGVTKKTALKISPK